MYVYEEKMFQDLCYLAEQVIQKTWESDRYLNEIADKLSSSRDICKGKISFLNSDMQTLFEKANRTKTEQVAAIARLKGYLEALAVVEGLLKEKKMRDVVSHVGQSVSKFLQEKYPAVEIYKEVSEIISKGADPRVSLAEIPLEF